MMRSLYQVKIIQSLKGTTSAIWNILLVITVEYVILNKKNFQNKEIAFRGEY